MLTSLSNPRVKHLVRLQTHSSQRKHDGVFCIESKRELDRALGVGFELVEAYVCPPLFSEHMDGAVTYVNEPVLRKIAYRQNPEGFVAVMRSRTIPLGKAPLEGLVLVLSALEKPGNIGAILRSADAAGASAVIVDQCDFDWFNPNTIRASTGAVFTLPIVSADRATLIEYLKRSSVPIMAMTPEGAASYTDVEWTGRRAIVLGAEAEGLDKTWRDAADVAISIPMRGLVDSLNVSVSAAVVLFEAMRQRQAAGLKR
ncbi:MAG: RNA methyltransferase [Planctomycetes bacterium]|nr:RNA methyltransferase [Planctomycetota bacterium]